MFKKDKVFTLLRYKSSNAWHQMISHVKCIPLVKRIFLLKKIEDLYIKTDKNFNTQQCHFTGA